MARWSAALGVCMLSVVVLQASGERGGGRRSGLTQSQGGRGLR